VSKDGDIKNRTNNPTGIQRRNLSECLFDGVGSAMRVVQVDSIIHQNSAGRGEG
jgi:hypothetical protein